MMNALGRSIWTVSKNNAKFCSRSCKPPKTQICPPPPKAIKCPRPPVPPCPHPITKPPPRVVCKTPEIPPNPCVPVFMKGNPTKFKRIFMFIGLPLIIIQIFRACFNDHPPPEKPICYDYEYMRRRTKRFPWGTGKESLFHNEHVNSLPGECSTTPSTDEICKK